jgi:hypothetical protein
MLCKEFDDCMKTLLQAYIKRKGGKRANLLERLNSLKPFTLNDLTADFSVTQQKSHENITQSVIRDGKVDRTAVERIGGVPDSARIMRSRIRP